MAIGRYTGRNTGGNPGFPLLVRNGRIPTRLLRRLETQPQMPLEEQWLATNAAIGLDAMVRAAHAEGVLIRLHEAYRTYARQEYFWQLYTSGQGNLAARPGTSNHGWATAIDVDRGADPSALPWMRLKARRYGWDLPDVLGHTEPWHWQAIRGWKYQNGVMVPPAKTEVPVYVRGELVPGAFYGDKGGRVFIFLRPVAEALGYEVLANGQVVALIPDEGRTYNLPLEKSPDGRAIFSARELCERLGLPCVWDWQAVRIG